MYSLFIEEVLAKYVKLGKMRDFTTAILPIIVRFLFFHDSTVATRVLMVNLGPTNKSLVAWTYKQNTIGSIVRAQGTGFIYDTILYNEQETLLSFTNLTIYYKFRIFAVYNTNN